MRIPFAPSGRSSVGIEWELALVDTDSGDLRQVAQTVLDAVELICAGTHPFARWTQHRGDRRRVRGAVGPETAGRGVASLAEEMRAGRPLLSLLDDATSTPIEELP